MNHAAAVYQITETSTATFFQKPPDSEFHKQLALWVKDGLHEGRESAAAIISEVRNEKLPKLDLSGFKNVTRFPDLSTFDWLKEVSFSGCTALQELPKLPENPELKITHVTTEDIDVDDIVGLLEEHDPEFHANLVNTTTQEQRNEIYEGCRLLFSHLKEDLAKAFLDNPLMHRKLLVWWMLRFVAIPFFWSVGFMSGARAGDKTVSEAADSWTAYAGAGIAAGVVEAFFSFVSSHFLSDPTKFFKWNSNGEGAMANTLEAGYWGIANFHSAFWWQWFSNSILKNDLSQVFSGNIMLIGLATGTIFSATLAGTKSLTLPILERVFGYKHFRPVNTESVFQDNIEFSAACAVADGFFGATGLDNESNMFRNITNTTVYELDGRSAAQAGWSALVAGVPGAFILGFYKGLHMITAPRLSAPEEHDGRTEKQAPGHQADTALLNDNKNTSGTFEVKNQNDLSEDEIETYSRCGKNWGCTVF